MTIDFITTVIQGNKPVTIKNIKLCKLFSNPKLPHPHDTMPQLFQCKSLPDATGSGKLTPRSPSLAHDDITALTVR